MNNMLFTWYFWKWSSMLDKGSFHCNCDQTVLGNPWDNMGIGDICSRNRLEDRSPGENRTWWSAARSATLGYGAVIFTSNILEDIGMAHDALVAGVVGGGTHQNTSASGSGASACCCAGLTHECCDVHHRQTRQPTTHQWSIYISILPAIRTIHSNKPSDDETPSWRILVSNALWPCTCS